MPFLLLKFLLCLQIQPYSHLPAPGTKEAVKELLDKLVVIKLNGGLGKAYVPNTHLNSMPTTKVK